MQKMKDMDGIGHYNTSAAGLEAALVRAAKNIVIRYRGPCAAAQYCRYASALLISR